MKPKELTTQNILNEVFSQDQRLSVKKFVKTYVFYRCVYLYHQISKKYENDNKIHYKPS